MENEKTEIQENTFMEQDGMVFENQAPLQPIAETKAQKQARFNWRDLVLGIGYMPVQFITIFVVMFVEVFLAGGSTSEEVLTRASMNGLFFSGLICFTFIVIAYKDYLLQQLKDFGKHIWRNLGIIGLTYVVTIAFRLLFAMFVSEDTAGNQEALETMFVDAGIIQYITLFGPLVIFAPFVEEMVTRKIIIGNTFKRNSALLTWSMLFVSGLVFGLLHFSGITPEQLLLLIPYMAMGWILGAAYIFTKNIYVPIFGHLLNNLIAVIMLMILM